MNETDEFYMDIALKEAKKGLGFTSPNPLVGALIVKEGKILSKGYHHKFGMAHAEIDAMSKLSTNDLEGSTMYVTLEPCCHYGKTPPCTEAIIKNKLKKVVIAIEDVDPRVKGKSIKILQNAGIEVEVGIRREAAYGINSIFFFYKRNNRPYIVLKAALTLDGKIATHNYNSKWISNEKSRQFVHHLRSKLKAIAIGKNTILNDKPRLNCRLDGFENKPIDKIVFSHSNDESLFDSFARNEGKNFIINDNIISNKEEFYKFCDVNYIDSVLIEGGSKVYSWFIDNNLIDRFLLFFRPSFLGKDGIPLYTHEGINTIEELKKYNIVSTKQIDDNILIDLSKGEPLCLQG